MYKIKISIIVPCYNVEEYLEKCVESILLQTYENWELILVNDGSKDKTPVICDKYCKIDKRIKVIHKDNGGLVSARNAGYEVATGEWLTYVDGDDWLDPTFIEKITKGIELHKDIDIIFFCMQQDMNGKTIKGKWDWDQYTNGKVYERKENFSLSSYILNYNSGISDVCAKAFRTKWCKEYNIKHNPILRQGEESVDFMMRAFYYANKSLFLKEYLYHYRFNENSISKRVDEKNAYYIVDCMNVINEFISQIPNNEIFIKEFELRNAYILVSIAMQIYFHPNNPLSFREKKKRYVSFINSNPLFVETINKTKCVQFDKFRIIAFWSIKKKHYFLLNLIGKIKQIALHKGFFRY